ncbi:MAG: hypothetical protein IJO32_01095 [Bacilli bacterium]|nr:hypothetical protein [Bacilli bacterium]
MKKKDINDLIKNYQVNESPLMLYDLSQLKLNIQKLLFLKTKYNVEFLFPVKAFPEYKVLKLFFDFGFGYDIANENEFNTIDKIINKDTLISFNGTPTISNKKEYNNIIYNLNSLNELTNKTFYNGIRINTYIKNKTEFSKFGIPIEKIKSINNKKIKSISFHFYEENKKKKLKHILNFARKCITIFKNLDYINFGGNWDVIDVSNFERNIIEIRKYIDNKIKIIFEVGENWFENCGYLVTKVISTNEISNKKIFYINAGKDSVAKWSVLKPVNLEYEKEDKFTYIISGNSCYEKDIFTVTNKKVNISINDKIVFVGLNGYSYAWCKEFNGSNSPEVIFYE